jgi:hypothetical protein
LERQHSANNTTSTKNIIWGTAILETSDLFAGAGLRKERILIEIQYPKKIYLDFTIACHVLRTISLLNLKR